MQAFYGFKGNNLAAITIKDENRAKKFELDPAQIRPKPTKNEDILRGTEAEFIFFFNHVNAFTRGLNNCKT